MGVVSNFLHQQKIEDKINAAIIKNSSFHFPKNTNQVILIATGTGIGPFLGMIDNNIKHTNLKLYWGGRNEKSFSIYKDFIEKQLERGHLQQLYTAYSRGKTSKKYEQQHNFFANSLENKNTIMICGSVAMQNEVLNTLHVICTTSLNKPLSYFQNRGQILMDCY